MFEAVLGVPGITVETELIISRAIKVNDFIPQHNIVRLMSFQRLNKLSGSAADCN